MRATLAGFGAAAVIGAAAAAGQALRATGHAGPVLNETRVMLFELVQPAVIAVLVVLEVAVFQLRIALATKGRKRSAALLGAANAVIQVAALGQVLTSLDRPANIAGYAVGVAIGVYLGATVDERIAGDPVEYRVVVPGDGAELVADLRALGWPVTAQTAEGIRGPAALLFVAVDAGRAADVARDLERLAPGAFRTSNRLRSAASAPLPPGYLSVGAGARLMWTRRVTRQAPPPIASITPA